MNSAARSNFILQEICGSGSRFVRWVALKLRADGSKTLFVA